MAAVGSILGQAIVLRVGLRPVAAIGMALMGGGALLLTQVSAGGSYFGDIFLGLLVFGPGVGFVFVTALIAALAGVPRRESGLASGLSKTSFQIGAALGLAIVTTVAVSRTEDYLAANTGENPLVALTEGFPVSLPRGRHLRRYRRRPPPFRFSEGRAASRRTSSSSSPPRCLRGD
jgi:predicted MFS family arabinose efflux permease